MMNDSEGREGVPQRKGYVIGRIQVNMSDFIEAMAALDEKMQKALADHGESFEVELVAKLKSNPFPWKNPHEVK